MDDRIQYLIDAELRYAQSKFPNNKFMLAALVEEVGELSQALIGYERGDKTSLQVLEEAIQVAVMAIRVAMEGSEEFSYKNPLDTTSESCIMYLWLKHRHND